MTAPSPIETGQVVAQLRNAVAVSKPPYTTLYRGLLGYAEECDRLALALEVEHDEARRAPLAEKYNLYAQLYRHQRDRWFGTHDQQENERMMRRKAF